MTSDIQRRHFRRNVARTPETGYRGGDFICAHAADRSLLKEGFTFAGAMVNDFTSWFGELPIGEQVALAYGTHVDEVRNESAFKYPNGLVERVKVDRHLNLKGSR